MRKPSLTVLVLAALFLALVALPLVASAASTIVIRPVLSKTTGITTNTRLTARGYAAPVPTRIRSMSAALILSKRNASGVYVRVKTVTCSLRRSGTRVNYTAAFGPLSAGRYAAKVRFVWVGTDRRMHVSTSPNRLFGVVRAPKTWTITEQNIAFVPSTLAVSVGDRVVFKNQDTVDHDVRIDGRLLALQGPGVSVAWIAPRTGTFPFICIIHPSMTGQITVK